MKISCLFLGHYWINGRVASREVRQLLNWKTYHNRYCKRCGKQEWAADKAEKEFDRIWEIRAALKETQQF